MNQFGKAGPPPIKEWYWANARMGHKDDTKKSDKPNCEINHRD